MKGHAPKFLLRCAGLVTFLLASFLVWHFGWSLIRRNHNSGLLIQPRTSNPADPKQLLASANYFYWLHNLPKSTPLYERAEEFATQAHDARDALYAKIGRIRSGDQMPFPELSKFLEAQLKAPLVQRDPALRLWCLGVKGDADDELNVAAAKQDWEAALSLAQQLGEREWAHRAMGELGLIGFLEGDVKRASYMMGKALLAAMADGDKGTEVRYLEIIGNGLNELNRPSEAMYFVDRAIAIANRDDDVGTPFMAYEGKAGALAAEGEMDEAQALMERTLAEARKENMLEHEGQDLLILGEFAMKSNQNVQARKYLEQAAQASTRVGLVRDVMQSDFDLSKLLQEDGDLRGAEAVLNKGLEISRTTGDVYYLPRALNALAELKAKTGQPEQAHALYKQAEDVIDGMLLRYPGSYAESSLLSAMSDTYLGDFKLAATQNEVDVAFGAIERARGRSVLDSMRGEAADPPTTDANSSLQSQISDLQNQLLNASDPVARSKLLENLFEQEEKLGYVNEALTRTQRRLATDSIALESAQASLEPDEAVLEYVLAEANSFCLVLTRNEGVIVRLPAGAKQIEQLTSRYLAEVTAGKFGEQQAKELYASLLKPIPESLRLKHLVIVPDGGLHNLPFDAMQRADGQYVLQAHVVSYAPSATVLCFLRKRQRAHEPAMAFLGVGAVPYDMEPQGAASGSAHGVMRAVSRGIFDISGTHLYALPETRNELISASKALDEPRQTVLLLGDEATEAAFKSEPLSNFKIIHFAVHGISIPNFPERDALVLGRDPRSKDDGLLQVREISQLSLDADLVTLSACNTAAGKLEGVEGSTGLVDAFLFAGARTVAASVWSLDDSSTGLLMKRFYAHLAQKEDVASALRQAKLDYLNQNNDKAPMNWAPFVVVGDASKPINF